MTSSVKVSARELKAALRGLVKVVRKGGPYPAVISLEDGKLVVESGGAAVEIAATGTWGEPVLLQAGSVKFLADLPTAEEFVYIKVEAGMFHAGGDSLPCHPANEPDRPIGEPSSRPPFGKLVAMAIQRMDGTRRKTALKPDARKAVMLLRDLASAGLKGEDPRNLPFPIIEVEEFLDWCDRTASAR